MGRTQCRERKETVPPVSKLMSHRKAISWSTYDSDAKEYPSALGIVLISRTTQGAGSPCSPPVVEGPEWHGSEFTMVVPMCSL